MIISHTQRNSYLWFGQKISLHYLDMRTKVWYYILLLGLV